MNRKYRSLLGKYVSEGFEQKPEKTQQKQTTMCWDRKTESEHESRFHLKKKILSMVDQRERE